MSALLARVRAWTANEFSTLAIVGAIAAALFVFVKLAEEVAEGETYVLDEAILLALRSPADPADPIGPWWLELTLQDLTSLGGMPILAAVTVIVLGYLLVERKYGVTLLVLASIGGGTVVSTLLKNAFERPRPELVAHLVEVRTLSFPSGHAMLSAVTFLTLGALLARVQPRRRTRLYLIAVAVGLTLVIGASRVYLGVHYPTDVLAGWSAGAAWAMICWLVAIWLQRRGQVEGTEVEPENSSAERPDANS